MAKRKQPKHHFTESTWPNLGKPRNADRRGREHLTPTEIELVIAAAGKLGRHGHRDSTMILVAYRHGLRVSELVSLRWDQVDLKNGRLHVRRRKSGLPSTHPLYGPELRALRKLLRGKSSEFGFTLVVSLFQGCRQSHFLSSPKYSLQLVN